MVSENSSKPKGIIFRRLLEVFVIRMGLSPHRSCYRLLELSGILVQELVAAN